MLNETEAWPGGQVVLEQFDVRRWTLGEHFYAAVIEVLHIADHLMPRGGPLRKKAIADALNVAADDKPARNVRHFHESPNLIPGGALRNPRTCDCEIEARTPGFYRS